MKTTSLKFPAASNAARPAHCRRRATTLRARLIHGALALAVLAIMANGASWLLTDAPATADELGMATSVIAVVSGNPSPADECPVAVPIHDQGQTHDQGHSL